MILFGFRSSADNLFFLRYGIIYMARRSDMCRGIPLISLDIHYFEDNFCFSKYGIIYFANSSDKCFGIPRCSLVSIVLPISFIE